MLSINELTPVHIELQSSPGAIGVGALSCRDTLDDLAPLVDRLGVELDALSRATAPANGRRHTARPTRSATARSAPTKRSATNSPTTGSR